MIYEVSSKKHIVPTCEVGRVATVQLWGCIIAEWQKCHAVIEVKYLKNTTKVPSSLLGVLGVWLCYHFRPSLALQCFDV